MTNANSESGQSLDVPTFKGKLRIVTIAGTRPELIKLSRVISLLDEIADHTLIHTGQNYDTNLRDIFLADLDLQSNLVQLDCKSNTPSEQIGRILHAVDQQLEIIKPQAVLLLGDTNSCLSAISAKKRRIPIFHMEAGNRSFDMRVPEETNRKIVDHISDVNLVYTEHARRNLLSEGLRPDVVFKTGSPMAEVIDFYRPKIDASSVLDTIGLEKNKYFVASFHREENVDEKRNLSKVVDSINFLCKKYSMPLVFSLHPRTRMRLKSNEFLFSDLVKFHEPLSFTDYVSLQLNAFCTVSDSGTVTEESALLNFPAVNARVSHERPEGVDAGSIIIGSIDAERIGAAVEIVIKQRERSLAFDLPSDYLSKGVSWKVCRVIFGYVDYVNRNIWKKGI
jgi:UDP-N-acetylglucosamine 2-epimerase (non-hydrolysing)